MTRATHASFTLGSWLVHFPLGTPSSPCAAMQDHLDGLQGLTCTRCKGASLLDGSSATTESPNDLHRSLMKMEHERLLVFHSRKVAPATTGGTSTLFISLRKLLLYLILVDRKHARWGCTSSSPTPAELVCGYHTVFCRIRFHFSRPEDRKHRVRSDSRDRREPPLLSSTPSAASPRVLLSLNFSMLFVFHNIKP